ncbi:low affinity K(+) transporter 1 [Monosporozyma unispora]
MAKARWKSHINQKLFSDVDESLFRNHSFKTVLSYALGTYLFLILKFAFFISDLYTCIKLLAYNRWSNNIIKPYLPFRISKWLFSACILLSIVFLLWNLIWGIRTYKTKNITKCYVNNFSRNFISVTDYSKFCIFDKISSHGSFQWFAFFVFFELKSCLGLIFCDTPRQVINGLTLWSVLITIHNGNGMNLGDLESFEGLINKIKVIAKENHEEAVLLSFSLFSFIIWVIFVAKLVFALVCSIFVYFELIREGIHSGLRDYIYTTISKHVDNLVVKQTEKRRNDVYKTHLLADTSSMLELDDLERDTIGSKPMFKLYNDSLNSFHRVGNSVTMSSNLDDSEMYEEYEVDETNSLNEPVPLMSTIPPQGAFFKKDYIRNFNINAAGDPIEEILESYRNNGNNKRNDVDSSATHFHKEEFMKPVKGDDLHNLSQTTISQSTMVGSNDFNRSFNQTTYVGGSEYNHGFNQSTVSDGNEVNLQFNQETNQDYGEYTQTYDRSAITNNCEQNPTSVQTPIIHGDGHTDTFYLIDKNGFNQSSNQIPVLNNSHSAPNFHPSGSNFYDSSQKISSNFNRPMPPSISVNSNLNSSNESRVFTPDRAYFRNIDLENSPFLPQEAQFDTFLNGHKY